MRHLQEDSPHGALLPVTAFTFEAPRVGACPAWLIILSCLAEQACNR